MSKKTYIIAEAGVNHNGSVELAYELIDAALIAGADAVKFQTFKADKLVTKTASKANYQVKNTNSNDSQFEMIKKLELSQESHIDLAKYCKKKNIAFLSSAFDEESLKFLVETIDVPLLKIPSGEITNAPFILSHARTGKKIVLSTGMCDLTDIENALGIIAFGLIADKNEIPSINKFKEAYYNTNSNKFLKENVVLLHCTTEYPAPLEEINLRVMETFSHAFQLPVGYSDHSDGISIPLAAVAMGATIIEKHFTLDKKMNGPDHAASLEPSQLTEMIKGIRSIEKALGSSIKRPTKSEFSNRIVARKSLIASTNINTGELFSTTNIAILRPGQGISPMLYWDLLEKKSKKNYNAGDLIDV